MKSAPISEQARHIMENLVSTVELAEDAPDFVAASFQAILDDYADRRLDEAATAVEAIDARAATAIRAMKRNDAPVMDELRKQFGARPRSS